MLAKRRREPLQVAERGCERPRLTCTEGTTDTQQEQLLLQLPRAVQNG